jgi:hypothetical protein
MTKLYILFVLLLTTSFSFAEDSQSPEGDFKCIEINLFTADKNNAKTRALKRAAKITELILMNIQQTIVAKIGDDTNGLIAMRTDEFNQCPQSNSLQLVGTVTDYKKDNQAMRYMVGFGAGKQKIETNVVLLNKSTGEVIAKGRVVDRKIGGIVGGSGDKGKRDFAEKINRFLLKALDRKSTT